MKKIFLILLISGLVSICLAQAPFYQSVTFDSAATASDSLKITPGRQIGGLFVAQGLTTSIQFEVSYDGSTWFWLQDPSDGNKYTVTIDSSMASAVALKPILCYPWNWYRINLGNAVSDTDNTSVKVVNVPYLTNEK